MVCCFHLDLTCLVVILFCFIFQDFRRSNLNFKLGLVCLIITTIFVATRFSLEHLWYLNSTFSFVFFCYCVFMLCIMVSFFCQFAFAYSHRWPFLERYQSVWSSFYSTGLVYIVDDGIIVFVSLATSFHMLARVLQGPCPMVNTPPPLPSPPPIPFFTPPIPFFTPPFPSTLPHSLRHSQIPVFTPPFPSLSFSHRSHTTFQYRPLDYSLCLFAYFLLAFMHNFVRCYYRASRCGINNNATLKPLPMPSLKRLWSS